MLYVMTHYQQAQENPYLTAGKFYLVCDRKEYSPNLCKIQDDTGYWIPININSPSAHLDDVGVFKLYEVKEVTGE